MQLDLFLCETNVPNFLKSMKDSIRDAFDRVDLRTLDDVFVILENIDSNDQKLDSATEDLGEIERELSKALNNFNEMYTVFFSTLFKLLEIKHNREKFPVLQKQSK